MTNEQLKDLEDKLWDSANALRAYGGLKAADYAVPILGLIFLKFADNKYKQNEAQILKTYMAEKGTRVERSIDKIAIATCGFYLPENARFEYLLDLPGEIKMAEALRDAMIGIEKYQDAKFQDVLPTEAYFEIEKKKVDILPQLLKSFSDIPKDASGDVFGKIYEYFLGKFALSEGQKGGEFFTPTSVVRFIVEVIEPYKGKIYDPACGSGGMFVQSGSFIREANQDLNDIYVCGQEYMGETVRLAKMNLLVNNLRGEIFETNSYENDPHNSYGAFDYVMANPPFNVKSVKQSTVKNDPRFYTYGLPKNKGKKDDKISDANYLWISLFATSLNATGRAGFVMPNSASDARNSEYDIRKKIVDSGIVDCMVSMPSNMFFTVTLPATLWFFDKAKVQTDRKDKILFIDARNVYKQIDRAHREWTEENQLNLAAIVRLYRGEQERYLSLISHYITKSLTASEAVLPHKEGLEIELNKLVNNLTAYAKTSKEEKRTPAKKKTLTKADFYNKLESFELTKPVLSPVEVLGSNKGTNDPTALANARTPQTNKEQRQQREVLQAQVAQNAEQLNTMKEDVKQITDLYKIADKNLRLKSDKQWSNHNLSRADKPLEEALQVYIEAIEQEAYWVAQITWLQDRFPEAEYKDVVGLCRLAGRVEYVEEQDYSLNAGRYVGVEIESDKITQEEFNDRLKNNFELLGELKNDSETLELSIFRNLKELIA